MKKEYLNFSLEELIENKQFIAWVLKGENSREWKKFIEQNPEFSEKVKEGKEIILLLRDTYEVLDEKSVLKMWQNIDSFDKQHKKKTQTIKFRRSLSWAASILLFFSIGTLGYFYLNNTENTYQFASSENSRQNNKASLVLSNGEEIALTNDNSTIALNNKKEQLIVNDSLIDLSDKKNKGVQMNEVIIPYGKKSKLILADGSKVWLNAGSRLAFPTEFTAKNREVFLEGEAYFEIAKNKNKAFIVNAGEVDIKVLGTHFNISAYPGDNKIETILLEGKVAVSTPKLLGFGKNEVLLKPYQKASFNKEKNSINVKAEPNADIYIAWTEGWFQFSNESLHSVFTKLERYYNVEIQTPKNFPFSDRITGKLDLKESLEDVMMALGDVAKIEYKINNNTIYINKKQNKNKRMD